MKHFEMKISASLIFLALLTGCEPAGVKSNEPFSFKELMSEPYLNIIEPDYFKTTDGIKLAFYKYKPVSNENKIVVFIHGGGAYSGAGYQYIAEGLPKKYNITTYLLDIRGHGLSGGNRGDSPTTERIWQDLTEFVTFVTIQNRNLPVYLGGHSSGGGLVINYATWKKRCPVSGYIFLSPKLGYFSNADRYPFDRDPFAKPNLLPIIINKISFGALCGNCTAVKLNYPKEIKENMPLFVDTYTCNMINATTPTDLKKHFSAIDKPFCLFIGQDDELFIPENTTNYFQYVRENIRQESLVRIIPGQKHLSIIRIADDLIGEYLSNIKIA